LANACGVNALCTNYAGNYTCSCQDGYTGNPYDGVRLLKVLLIPRLIVAFSRENIKIYEYYDERKTFKH
jgi:hypothetical protein